MKKTLVVIIMTVVMAGSLFAQNTADEWFKKGLKYFNAKDYTNAVAAFTEAIKVDSSNVRSYKLRAVCNRVLKNYDACIADYNALIKANDLSSYASIGSIYYENGDYTNAITAYNNYLKYNPNDITAEIAEAYFMLGNCYFYKNDYSAAITSYSKAIESNLYNAEYYMARGKAYIKLKKYDIACADFDTVIRIKTDTIKDFPNVGGNYKVRSDAYAAKGDYYKAAADYQKYLSLKQADKPVEFTVDKSNPADMWFCATLYMNLQISRFLGKSDDVNKYEKRLGEVCAVNPVTRADIEAFYKKNIGGYVKATLYAEFKKNYDGYVPYNEYVNSGHGKALEDMTEIVTIFFMSPNQDIYSCVWNVYDSFRNRGLRGSEEAIYDLNSYSFTLENLSASLAEKVRADKNVPLPSSASPESQKAKAALDRVLAAMREVYRR